jgi:hypothetical protein
MGSQENVQPRKKRGPPPTGKGKPVQVRLQPDLLEMVDAYARQMEWPIRPTFWQDRSRPEAIRRILVIYFTNELRKAKRRKKKK